MTRTIYALLVGIDRYEGAVPDLEGCLNDIVAVRTYLEQVEACAEGVGVEIAVLTDEQATRDRFVNTFRSHLGRATQKDIVLFYYSGHGSQEAAPPELWHLEPDRRNETIVLHDSRTEGGWDLSDKEINALLREVGRRSPHMVVILDCCHSGSGTRDATDRNATVRTVRVDTRIRPWSSYLFAGGRSAGDDSVPPRATLEPGSHVLLAACRNDEYAIEVENEGKKHGVFSLSLLRALRAARGRLSYRDLFAHADALVRSRIKRQSPQLESFGDARLDALFLDGTVRRSATTFSAFFRDGAWTLDGGAVHGLSSMRADEPNEQTLLYLYRFDATKDEVLDPSKRLGAAHLVEAAATTSRLRPVGDSNLDREQSYKARLVALPLTSLPVEICHGGEIADGLRERVGGSDSLYVRLASEEEVGEYFVSRIEGAEERYEILDASGASLVPPIESTTQSEAVSKLFVTLEHLARWALTARLQNPETSIDSDEIELSVWLDGQRVEGPEINLRYSEDETAPEFQLEVENKGGRKLYFALLNLTEKYKISTALQSGLPCVGLEPGHQWRAFEGRTVAATVPEDVWQAGATRYQDVLKLIVSTEGFDARLLEQSELEDVRFRGGFEGSQASGSLDQLMQRLQYRDLGPTKPASLQDWYSREIRFVTERPLPGKALGEGDLQLVGGVEVRDHPSLRARFRPTSSATCRDKVPSVPPLLSPGSRFPFASVRSVDGHLDTLELDRIENYDSVTAEEPLRLRISKPLRPGEHVIPVSWDGEVFLPLGRAREVKGTTEVLVERLPTPTADGRKSVAGSIRIYLHKLVSEVGGGEFAYPRLSLLKEENGAIARHDDSQAIRAHVEAAKEVVVCLHGIFGDSDEMGERVYRLVAEGDSRDRARAVLCFDYENLNTPISETARALGRKMAGVGLDSSSDTKLTLVAHSMGGLVSRWWIEREGGNAVATHLIMLGTPNAGSPWPTVQNLATFVLTLGLNGLSVFAWPLKILGRLLAAYESIDVNLEQMGSDSVFLEDLNASSDPKVPYTVIVGKTSLDSAAVAGGNGTLADRLFRALFLRDAHHVLADAAFLYRPNDIAVSVESMRAIAGDRQPAPRFVEVASDHLSYFSQAPSLAELAAALRRV